MAPTPRLRRGLMGRRWLDEVDAPVLPPWTRADESEQEDQLSRKRSTYLRAKRASTITKNLDNIIPKRQDPDVPTATLPPPPPPSSVPDFSESESGDGSESESDDENLPPPPPPPPPAAPAAPEPSLPPPPPPPPEVLPPPTEAPVLTSPLDIEIPVPTDPASPPTSAPAPPVPEPPVQETQAPEPSVQPPPESSSTSTSTSTSSQSTLVSEPVLSTVVPAPVPTTFSSAVFITSSTSTTTTQQTSEALSETSIESILNSLPPISSSSIPVSASSSVVSITSSASPSATETAASDRAEQDAQPGHPPPDAAERALHAMGAIGGVFFIIGSLYVLWRLYRKFSGKDKKQGDNPDMGATSSSARTSNLGQRAPFLARLPFIGTRFAGWQSFDNHELHPNMPVEKKGQKPQELHIITQPTQMVSQPPPAYFENQESRVYQVTKITDAARHMPQQSFSSTAGQFNNTLRTNDDGFPLKRFSEVSSLSSGFGDNDAVIPVSAVSATSTTRTEADNYFQGLAPRPPRRGSIPNRVSRSTWYTETSEDSAPRFRTVNSWVRQQTGRVKRQRQRDEQEDVPPVPALPPSEQEFVMMMPDGEEPRRVVA